MPLLSTRLSLGPLVAVGHRALRLLGLERAPASGENDPQAADAMRRAEAARAAGHADEARTLFRYVVQRWPAHVGALHALRDLAVETRAWDEAIGDKRLEALPFARYCIDCQRVIEQEERMAAG